MHFLTRASARPVDTPSRRYLPNSSAVESVTRMEIPMLSIRAVFAVPGPRPMVKRKACAVK